MDLKDRTVLITGASRGLGALIARDLAKTGARLVLAARDAKGLEALAVELGARAIPCDVADPAQRERLIAEAGEVDVLVNNAGIEIPVAVLDIPMADVERTLAVNLLAPIHLTKLALPGMVARGRGAVVMISSMSGKSPTPYNATYAATKYALNGFTASLRIELRDTGVHAGVVCPSFVAEAGMWADTGVKAPAMLREVRPERVVGAVRRVIDGASEVLVTPGPIRPLLALAQLFPRLDGALLKRMGILAALEQRAAHPAAR